MATCSPASGGAPTRQPLPAAGGACSSAHRRADRQDAHHPRTHSNIPQRLIYRRPPPPPRQPPALSLPPRRRRRVLAAPRRFAASPPLPPRTSPPAPVHTGHLQLHARNLTGPRSRLRLQISCGRHNKTYDLLQSMRETKKQAPHARQISSHSARR
jgi:hypothetical protein